MGWAAQVETLGAPQCSDFVREQLTPVMEQIRSAKVQLERLSEQIKALVQKEQIPTGLGALTVSLIGRGGVRLAPVHAAQSCGQLHRLLSGVSTARAQCNASAQSTGTATST